MSSYECLSVERIDKKVTFAMSSRNTESLKPDEVRIQLEYSSLNYKDALCASGHPGVAQVSPLVPGIDAVGEIVESENSMLASGQKVIIAHEQFGTRHDGGWAQFASVPGEWVVPLPNGLDAKHAMVWGTAGFTAAQSVMALQLNSIFPKNGPVLVTGATGGVGICSVMLLKKLGYEIVAVSGKKDKHQLLSELGATEIIDRSDFVDDPKKPMLSSRFAGAIDTVGGPTLVTVVKSIKRGGCVTACGNVGGVDLPLSVFPFILRGVNLQGIDSAGANNSTRANIWNRLATDWSIPQLGLQSETIKLSEAPKAVQKILDGKITGRTVVEIPNGN